jgi:hypothetical protein
VNIAKRAALTGVALLALLACGAVLATPASAVTDAYLDEYFRVFPTRATEAGRHDHDEALEDFSTGKCKAWVAFNHQQRQRLVAALADKNLPFENRLDAEALLAQIDRELHAQTVLRRPERDPLYWSNVIANATVFLLVRDDLPLAQRQQRARARARLLPRFAQQARETFAHADPSQIAPELCQIAAGQVRASATFYKDGFAQATGGTPEAKKEGNTAANALSDLASRFDEVAKHASGSPRLASAYAATFRLGTGVDEAVPAVLTRAERDLAATRSEAAAYGRQVWSELIGPEPPPADDRAVLRRLFARVAADRDRNIDEYAARWKTNVQAIEQFVRE